jgi:hypothetical protein
MLMLASLQREASSGEIKFGKRLTDGSFTNILRGYLSLPKIALKPQFDQFGENCYRIEAKKWNGLRVVHGIHVRDRILPTRDR